MMYFRYSLNEDGVGPASYLPNDAVTGIYYNDTYYGCADINSLQELQQFNAVAVPASEYFTAAGKPWEAFIAGGYTQDGETYDITDEALSRWTQTLVLLRESGINETASFAIADVHGQLHVKPVANVRSLLVNLGYYWNQGWIMMKSATTGSI